jgi:hypothetical protein
MNLLSNLFAILVMILCDYCLNFLCFVNRGNLSCLFWIG